MLYSVAEVSESIGVSKQSIYNKMKLKELEEHITKKQGITYIDEVGLNLIRSSLNTSTDDLKGSKNKRQDSTLNEEATTREDDSTFNNDIFNLLKEQIKEKDLQIRELHKLIENNQVLLKDKPQEIKLLEEHFQDIDSKMMEIKQDMQERKEPQKGLFKRIFRK
jgi:hypothetical protein